MEGKKFQQEVVRETHFLVRYFCTVQKFWGNRWEKEEQKNSSTCHAFSEMLQWAPDVRKECTEMVSCNWDLNVWVQALFPLCLIRELNVSFCNLLSLMDLIIRHKLLFLLLTLFLGTQFSPGIYEKPRQGKKGISQGRKFFKGLVKCWTLQGLNLFKDLTPN